MRQSELQRSTKRMRRQAPKKRRLLPDRYKAIESAFEDAGVPCFAVDLLPDIGCWFADGRPDPHELVTRADWADGVYVAANIRPVCRGHHDHITAMAADDAYALGVRIPLWERPPEWLRVAAEVTGRAA